MRLAREVGGAVLDEKPWRRSEKLFIEQLDIAHMVSGRRRHRLNSN
jgi:hypothetical protein